MTASQEHQGVESTPRSSTQRESKKERVRRYLIGAGISREDSDDELGLVDHPWEWIYAPAQHKSNSDGSHADAVIDSIGQNGDDATKERPLKRRKTLAAAPGEGRRIIGAQMGSFSCYVGDCVLLKAEGTNEAWVGLLCEFLEEEDEEGKAANFMWFSTEKEIRSKAKKRMDFMQNELYITPSWDNNPLASINGRATIVSAERFLSKYPNGRVPRNSPDFGKIFICRRGCNTRTATYTEEFIWEDTYQGTDKDIFNLIERVKNGTKASRRKYGSAKISKTDDEAMYTPQSKEAPETPRKKRKYTSSTPQSSHTIRTPTKTPSSAHKKIIIKKPLEFTPLGTRFLSPSTLLCSPFQMARSQLHVASVPATLPCREEEFSTVYRHLEAAISDGVGTCIYISGTPGTGKTATVREVVSQLTASVMAEELDDFIFVEINGMKVTDPHQSYSLLWEALRNERVSPSHALELLEREFSHPSPRRVPCVVLMDELDQLVTKKQSVMYNFFNWPSLAHSRLIVLAVANTMDLPERTLSNKISSRLGLTRITFPGYTHAQLQQIIRSRLEGVPGQLVDRDAIEFAARKVASVSGDARRALDICRRAVELAEAEDDDKANNNPPPTPSKHGPSTQAPTRVRIATIKQAIQESTSSPLLLSLPTLPLTAKLLLVSLLSLGRRTGLAESTLGDLLDESLRLARTGDCPSISRHLLHDVGPRVRALDAAAVLLAESGIIALEVGRGERTSKIRLGVGSEDVSAGLRPDVDVGRLILAA